MQKLMVSQLSKTDILETVNVAVNDAFSQNVQNLIQSLLEPSGTKKDFLSRKETAEFFGVSVVTIHAWVNEGLISSYKMGNRTYFKRSQLIEQLLNSKTVA